jgi:hypothetical protein
MKPELKVWMGAPLTPADYKFIQFELPCGRIDTAISMKGLFSDEVSETRAFIEADKGVAVKVYGSTESAGGIRIELTLEKIIELENFICENVPF